MAHPAHPSPPRQNILAQARAALEGKDARLASELALRQLQSVPNSPDAHYVAGLAALELQQLSLALEHLHLAANLPPRRPEYILEFAKALVRGRRTGDALQIANTALTLSPQDPMILSTLGLVYSQCHAHERAAAVFRRAAAMAPENSACRFNYAMSLVFSGNNEQAETELEACLKLEPTCWPAYGLLSRLRRQTPDRNHVDRLVALLDQAAADPMAASQLHMALGKELEDLGDYAGAFAHFTAGKSIAASTRGYSISRDETLVQSLVQAFPEGERETPPDGCRSDEPIFIIGMPRSGTTLVERILSSHPEVQSVGELDNFGIVLDRLYGGTSPEPLGPEIISRVREMHWEQLGEHYLSSTRPLTSLKPRFVDKLPHNFLYAGFIARALPNAKIICLRRNPLDTCLGNLRESFSAASPFHGYSFKLLDIGHHYILFDHLMAHWERALPGRILEIDYEALVESPEAMTRQLLQHCDLPWNDACLHFERNQSSTTTASSLQVRAPLHRAAIGRWKKYEAELQELKSLLNAAGIDWAR
jgi:Flp pilus assembly protein TadD